MNSLLFEECSAANGDKIDDILKEMVSSNLFIIIIRYILNFNVK